MPASPPAVTSGGTLGDLGPGPASASTEEGLAQQPPAQPRPPEQEQLRLFSLWCSASRLHTAEEPQGPAPTESGQSSQRPPGWHRRWCWPSRACVCACVSVSTVLTPFHMITVSPVAASQ